MLGHYTRSFQCYGFQSGVSVHLVCFAHMRTHYIGNMEFRTKKKKTSDYLLCFLSLSQAVSAGPAEGAVLL